MRSDRIKANIKVNDVVYPFILKPEDEPYYREASKQINERLAVLKGKYSAHTTPEKLVGVVAVEALVDALMLNERYIDLQNILTAQLEDLEKRFV